MAAENNLYYKKWNIIKEQLIALSVISKTVKINDDFKKLLDQDISRKNLNSQIVVTICYFLLGFIDIETRDKLIKWPLINIQTHTKFRKGLSTMVVNFQEKYPWANIKKLPESYFVNPHGCQKKFLDFVLRLTNLAIHLTLNDPKLLIMHSGNGINNKEIDIMLNVVSKAKQNEEESMLNYVFPIDQFELIKNEVTDKCIALKQENDELEQEVNKLLKSCNNEKCVSSDKNIKINDLKTIKEEKLSKLNLINQDISLYFKTSEEFLSKLNAIKNPVYLSATDFDTKNFPLNITSETLRVCENLHDLYQNLIFSNDAENDDEYLYNQLLKVKETLKEEIEAYKTFLSKNSNYYLKNH